MTTGRFLRNLSLLIITCFVSFILIRIILEPTVRNNKVYLAASLVKENRLATVPAPRLIFVGGSNLALGLNSQRIDKTLGLHVINMGLHAGLGLNYPLNETLSGLKRGDLIVLSIEHFLSGTNAKLISQLIDINPSSYSFFDLSPFDAIRVFGQSTQRCLSTFFYKLLSIDQIDPIYNLQGFTREGDLISHFNKNKPTTLAGGSVITDIDYSDGIAEINQFIKDAKSKGASVYFTFPSYPESAYKLNSQALSSLSDQYKKNLHCPILGSVSTFVMPDHYFFDTVYHLDSAGVQKRTDMMINLLRNRSQFSE